MNPSPAEIREAFGRIPKPLREFVAEGHLVGASQKLGNKFNLHVDQIGSLVQLLTMVLLGFTKPEELPSRLTSEFGFLKETTTEFIRNVNTEIFIPLQKEVKEVGNEPSHEERIAAEEVENPRPVIETPKLVVKEPTTSIPPPSLIQKPPEPVAAPTMPVPVAEPIPEPVKVEEKTPSFNLIRPEEEKVEAVKPAELVPTPAPISTPVETPKPTAKPALASTISFVPTPAPVDGIVPHEVPEVRTMAKDMQYLQHPEERLAHYAQIPANESLPAEAHITPARSFQTASVPVNIAAPVSVPVEKPVIPIESPASYTIEPVESPIPSLVQTPVSVSAAPQPYSGDPYRESI